MKNLYKRVMDEACYIIEKKATVRDAAKVFSVSKSTVHKDMVERLPGINKEVFLKVRAVLDKNLEERHLRGGAATRALYKTKDQK